MNRKLLRKISPQAKKSFLQSVYTENQIYSLRISRPQDIDSLIAQIEALGGSEITWLEELSLLSVKLSPAKLLLLAQISGVSYVDTGGHYAPGKYNAP